MRHPIELTLASNGRPVVLDAFDIKWFMQLDDVTTHVDVSSRGQPFLVKECPSEIVDMLPGREWRDST